MKRKRIGIILVVLGAIIALGLGAYVYTTAEQANEIASHMPTVDVVVAQVELPERVQVPAAAVALMKVPAEMVPPDAVTKVVDAVGKYPLGKIYKNEIIIAGKLADSAGKTGPAFTLKPGMVVVTYPGADLLTPTGAVRPGDKVDILLTLTLPKPVGAASAPGQTQPSQGGQGGQATGLATLGAVSQTLLQNVEVIRIGNFPAAGTADTAAPAGKSISFQVSHQDALILKWAKDSGGTIDLVLRQPSDKEPVDTEAITPSYIFKKFKFQFADPLQ